MILNIIFPLRGLFGIYYTFSSFIPYVTQKILLFIRTILTFPVQTLFVEHIFPYNTYFNTEQKHVHYLFPLFEDYVTNN